MKDKIIKVSESTHKRIKSNAIDADLKIGDYVDVISHSLPFFPQQEINIGGHIGEIVVADTFLSDQNPNINNLLATMAIVFPDMEHDSEFYKDYNNKSSIEFKLVLGEEMFKMSCNEIYVDFDYWYKGMVRVFISIDNYMEACQIENITSKEMKKYHNL